MKRFFNIETAIVGLGGSPFDGVAIFKSRHFNRQKNDLTQSPRNKWPILNAICVAILLVSPAAVHAKAKTKVAPPATQDQLVIKIGLGSPKTGPYANLGRDIENGASLAVFEINKSNLLSRNRKNYRLELISVDDMGNPEVGVRAAEALIQQNAVAVIGHLNSEVSIPTNVIYSQFGMAQISPSATNQAFTETAKKTPDGHRSAFQMIPNDAVIKEAIAQTAMKEFKTKKIMLLDDGSEYSQKIIAQYQQRLAQEKIQIIKVDTVSVEPAQEVTVKKITKPAKKSKPTPAVSSKLIQQIQREKPQLIIWSGHESAASDLAKQLYAAKISTPIVSSDGTCTNLFWQSAGSTSNGHYCIKAGLALDKMPLIKKFRTDYEAYFTSQTPQLYSPYAYDAVYVIANAIKNAKQIEREDVAEQIALQSWKGVTGPIKFNSSGQNIYAPFTLYKVFNAQLLPKQTLQVDISKLSESTEGDLRVIPEANQAPIKTPNKTPTKPQNNSAPAVTTLPPLPPIDGLPIQQIK